MTAIDVKECAALLKVSIRHVRRLIGNGRLPSEFVASIGGERGKKHMIPLNALPVEARVRYWAQRDETENGDFDLTGYKEKHGEKGLEELMSRLDAVREMIGLRKSGAQGICEKREEIAKRLNVTSGRLYQLEKAYEEQGLKGIAENVKRSDKGCPRSMCLMAQDFVQAESCRATRPTGAAIFETLKRLEAGLKECACEMCPYNEGTEFRDELLYKGKIESHEKCEEAKTGMKLPKSLSTVSRYVKSIPKNIRDLGRFGVRYWEDKYMPKARREKPNKVNEVWFGDHHVFDVFVLDDQGRAVRPWLTAWTDAKSGCMVGWALSLNPNSDTIVESLTRAIGVTKGSEFWGAPNTIYIDNGKDYRCTRLEGKNESEYSQGQLNISLNQDYALLKLLGIKTVHAIPYRAWSKTIERIFGTIERGWIQGALPGFCGNDPQKRPESLNDDIKNKRLLRYDEFCAYFINTILPEYHQRENEQGLSPIEIYRTSEKARGDEKISWAVLATAKNNRETRRVMTSGIRFNNRLYFSPELINYIGENVTILYSRLTDESISVIKDNEFICEAPLAEKLKLVGESEEKLKKHMQMQKNAKRQAKEALNIPFDRIEALNNLVLESPDLMTGFTITSIVHERAYREKAKVKKLSDYKKGRRTVEESKSESRIREKLLEKGKEALRAAKG